jgi:hypothetical protein
MMSSDLRFHDLAARRPVPRQLRPERPRVPEQQGVATVGRHDGERLSHTSNPLAWFAEVASSAAEPPQSRKTLIIKKLFALREIFQRLHSDISRGSVGKSAQFFLSRVIIFSIVYVCAQTMGSAFL